MLQLQLLLAHVVQWVLILSTKSYLLRGVLVRSSTAKRLNSAADSIIGELKWLENATHN
jgi:hypothetical protein